jgi:hypothetical protein
MAGQEGQTFQCSLWLCKSNLVAVGNKCYYALGPILKRTCISQSIKIRLYKTIIRPAVTYGTEIWTVTSKTEKNVDDVGEKDTEENIWTNKGGWTVEN